MIPFSKRPKNAGQFVLIIAPTGQGKNVLFRQLISENLSHERIMLVSDSAGEAIDGNDLWYRGSVRPSSELKPLVEKLLAAKLQNPTVRLIDDPAMNHNTIDYLQMTTFRRSNVKFNRQTHPTYENHHHYVISRIHQRSQPLYQKQCTSDVLRNNRWTATSRVNLRRHSHHPHKKRVYRGSRF